MTEKIAGEPCLEHAYRVQLTSRTILSFSNVLVQSSGGSRPADGGGGGGWGGGHPDPEITGGLASKKFFSTLRALFSSKNKGGSGSPGPYAGSATPVSGKHTKTVVWTRSMRFR